MIRSGLLLASLLTAALAACGGDPDNAVPTLAPASTPGASTRAPTAAPGAGSTLDRGSFELTGAVSGTMTFNAVSCASAGNIAIALAGPVGTAQYSVEISAQRAGTYNFGQGAAQGSVPTVQLTDRSPGGGGKAWSAGQSGRGAGSMTIGPRNNGSIDADLQAAPGAAGAVRVKGSWRCS